MHKNAKEVSIMDIVEIKKTIRKHITVVKKTIIKPGIDYIIAIPKRKENEIQTEEEND